jgi:4-aminobutyrate aminotransferase
VELHGVSVQDSLDFIQHLFKSDIEPSRVAAIILEPVQGEGGFYQAPLEFMRALRKLCDEHGILLVVDEVQTGFGRTGKWFAMEHYDVLPDIMTMAKSMAGGTNLSAVCGRAEIMDAPAPGGLGGTYAGSPLGIAAAHAVIDAIESENLLDRSNKLGDKLKAHLNSKRSQFPGIVDVRGPGSMIACEFNDPKTGKPDADFVKRVQLEAKNRGLILLTCGVYFNVIRFLYPLTISDKVFDEALAILDASMVAAAA